ncbi:hypothetical protein [Neisseria perflava]|uniref:hypothetical protein n=1 Tax=Neisseria perflava TaxID=33053 RepID=UPI0020A004E6|nr:hypothetical protein [Neisseria perflava]MCP1660519.1 putative transcriptional regulator [Neisseria perflava]MCP1772070.1 putative transcriptional regulator [Neisseria perflava]
MLAQIELSPSRAAALAKLEQETGESQSSLLLKMFDSYIEQKREYDELSAAVARGRADIAAGRSVSHDDAVSRARNMLRGKAAQ